VKHNNPCGAAVAATLERAFALALAGDPVSAFGGILATNRTFDAATAQAIVQSGTFLEVIVAPHVEPAAIAALQQAKWGPNVRVLDLGGVPSMALRQRFVARQVSGGFLLQTADFPAEAPKQDVAGKRAPSDTEKAALRFAWKVCKHVKSNAIVLATQAADGVQQGFLEGSNVDSLQELVQMITVERSFTATQKALSGIGRLQENLITNILR